jgi:hypothetical protein
MDAHPTLTMTVYILLVAFALLVIAYWVAYTRRMKIPPNVGKEEGISIATQEKERTGHTGSIF